jgi:hypothetical protein
MNAISKFELPRGQGNAFLNKLEAAGLTSELAQQVVDSKDNELAKKTVRFIASGGIMQSVWQKRAREIMCTNMFGIEDAVMHLNVKPNKVQLAALERIPFSEEILYSCKNTHLLVAVFPLSLSDLWDSFKFQEGIFARQHPWFTEKNFGTDRGVVGWRLIRKTPVEGSIQKEWDDQQKLLSKDEVVPSTRIVVYAMIAHFKMTGERLFQHLQVRCADKETRRAVTYTTIVGYFDSFGIRVAVESISYSHLKIGLASAVKPQD